MSRIRLIVIGNGMAGMRTVEELLRVNPNRYDITVFGMEPYGNYNRIMLPSVLSGEKNLDEIVINDRNWYLKHEITLHIGFEKTIVNIDRIKRQVYAQDGMVADYDRLLIATGSKELIAEIPGNTLEGVISFRNISDVLKMLKYSQSTNKAVVLGGGLLGLEAANGLMLRGMDVTVIHNNPVLLNRQIDGKVSQLLQLEMEKKGLKFKTDVKVKYLIGDNNDHIMAVYLETGEEIACELFVMAIGVSPNITLAQGAGLNCDKGIVVNNTLQSSDPRIYAVGECIQYRGDTFGLVAPLYEQAKVCANHLGGDGTLSYVYLPSATKLKVTGINLFSMGDFIGDENSETIYFSDTTIGIYKKLVIKANKLVGAILYGDIQDSVWYQELLEKDVSLADIRDFFIFGKVV